ncbi:MAG: ribosomal protein S18-alanine N-acetyltransferase [Clostridia bacterium]|nr:ribosomal protein S18-alanine N-acetyltransferase [Clostridia bacterium]
MITKFTENHLESVFENSNQCFENGWNYSLFQQELKQTNRLNFVYEENGKVVAYCFSILGLDTLEILDIAVLPKYRHNGIAKKLLSHIENLAKQQNPEISFYLEVSEKNEIARKVYEKLGYSIISKRKDYYGKDNSALIMEKK